MGASEQSTEIEVNGIRMYINLWRSEKDAKFIGYEGVMPKGTWHFFTTYRPEISDAHRLWIAKKTDGPLLHSAYPSEQDAKDAVRILIKNLEANWDGWGDGHSGMPSAYVGLRRSRR